MLLISTLFVIPCLAASISGVSTIGSYAKPVPSVPRLEHLFTGIFQIANPLKPIPIDGGVRVVEPITGGKISGSALNATVTGGVAYPSIFDNGTLQDAFITTFGTTSDGAAFFVQVSGVGKPTEQFASIKIEIGGESAKLADDFILASIVPSADRKTVTVEGYKVSEPVEKRYKL